MWERLSDVFNILQNLVSRASGKCSTSRQTAVLGPGPPASSRS